MVTMRKSITNLRDRKKEFILDCKIRNLNVETGAFTVHLLPDDKMRPFSNKY